MSRIAFIGIGTMGLPMARHLVAAGHDVIASDLDAARARQVGCPVAATAEAVAAAELAITSLPTPAAVEEVVLGLGGVRDLAASLDAFIDVSTGPPALARRLAAELETAGVESVDAPVSGGPRGAAEGTLTVMVGAGPRGFARADPILRSFGGLVVHVGGPGAGQAAKLCNNLIAGATMAAIAESCATAEREGIDPATLYEILAGSTADSRVLRTRFPLPGVDPGHPSSNRYEPLFALDLMAKDLALAQEVACQHGLRPPVLEAALSQYREAQQAGHGPLDYSAVYLVRRSERVQRERESE